MSYLKKLKFNSGLNKLEKLELKFNNNTSRDFDLVSWQLCIGRMKKGAETEEQYKKVDEAINVFKCYLLKHFPMHSFLDDTNSFMELKEK